MKEMDQALLLHLNRAKGRAFRASVKDNLEKMMNRSGVVRENVLVYRGVPYVKSTIDLT